MDDDFIPPNDEETLAECWGKPIDPLTDDLEAIRREMNE